MWGFGDPEHIQRLRNAHETSLADVPSGGTSLQGVPRSPALLTKAFLLPQAVDSFALHCDLLLAVFAVIK